MIYRYASSKSIIAKVFRDLRLKESGWILDGIEWIGEALDAIGTSVQTGNASQVVKTSSHSAPLPAGLVSLTEVRYGLYNSTSVGPPNYEDFPYVLPYNSGFTRAHIPTEDTINGVSFYKDEDYYIKGQFIVTSFEEDWICLLYKSLEVDDDGFPMVPDHFSFSQAAYWYIVMKKLEGGYSHPGAITWDIAEQRWLKYCTQARSKAMMPDESKASEILKNWLTFLPNYQHDSMAEKFNRQDTIDPRIFRVEYPDIPEEQ